MSEVIILLLLYFFSWLLIPAISFISRGKRIKDYESLSAYLTDNSVDTGKWAAFWIFALPFLTLIISYFLYELNQVYLISVIWLLTPFYWINVLVIILFVLGRKKLIDLRLIVLMALVSSIISYLLYSGIITKGRDFILPNWEEVRDAFWIGTTAFLIYQVSQSRGDYNEVDLRKKKFLRKKISEYKLKFDKIVNDIPEFKLRAAAMTIIFMEDFNRPRIIRSIENIAARLGRAKTTGIAQQKGMNTDEESVKKLVTRLYKTRKKESLDYEDMLKIFSEINGEEYASACMDIYHDLLTEYEKQSQDELRRGAVSY